MVSKNFKVLEVMNGNEYIFSSFSFKASVRKYKSEKKSQNGSLTSEMVLEKIAEAAHVSVDSIKNWMYAKNGPSDLETVKVVANFLNVNYVDLLKKQERKNMSENKIVDQETIVNMDKTKDIIRVVYQKMSSFMDAAVQELCFDADEETFYTYENVYKDMLGTLHRSMLDIPIDIYDQLKEIAEGDLYLYMYGSPDVPADVWDLVEFHNFCDAKDIDGVVAQMFFMEKQADKFYAKIREILKKYLVV